MNIPAYLSAGTIFINLVWKQMCRNCWSGTRDQSIYFFPPVYWETTYKLRLYLSYNSSQVWPTRISGVIESVFQCSGPNSKSIVTLTRPTQRKNVSLHLLPFSWTTLPLATLILIIVKLKSAQGAQSLRQMQFHSMPNAQGPETLTTGLQKVHKNPLWTHIHTVYCGIYNDRKTQFPWIFCLLG